MSFNWNGFKPEEHVDADFEAIPDGDYPVIVTYSDEKPTKAGNGTLLELKLDIIEGQCMGRKLFAYINLENTNPKVSEIGQSELASLCRATGIANPRSSIDFVNRTMIVTVGHGEYQGRLVNRVKRFTANGALSAPITETPPQKTSSRPWEKK